MPRAPLLRLRLALLLRSVFALGDHGDGRGRVAAATGGAAWRLSCRRGERAEIAAKQRCGGMWRSRRRRRGMQRMCSGSSGVQRVGTLARTAIAAGRANLGGGGRMH